MQLFPSRWRRLALHGLILYVALVAILFFTQRSLLYQPFGHYQPPESRGLPHVQELRLPTADGQQALAWFSPPAEDSTGKLLLYFHGNGGHIGQTAWLLRMMQEAGFGWLAPEYRGYPGYDGHTTEQGLYHDARAAMEFALQSGYQPQDIILFGHSLGSGIAVQLATEYTVGMVALISPFTSVADAAAHLYWYVPARWLVRDRFDSAAKAAHITAPVMIFHGTEDSLIPIRHGRALYERIRAPKQFFPLEGQNHHQIDFRFILRELARASLSATTGGIEYSPANRPLSQLSSLLTIKPAPMPHLPTTPLTSNTPANHTPIPAHHSTTLPAPTARATPNHINAGHIHARHPLAQHTPPQASNTHSSNTRTAPFHHQKPTLTLGLSHFSLTGHSPSLINGVTP